MKLHLFVDGDDTALKIHTIPCEAENLTFANTGKQSCHEDGFKAGSLRFFQKKRNLIIVKGNDLGFLNTRQDTGICRIETDIADQNCLPQCLVKHAVDVLDRLGGKTLGGASWTASEA